MNFQPVRLVVHPMLGTFKTMNFQLDQVGLFFVWPHCAVLWQYFDLNLVKQATVKYQGTMDCSLCAVERGVIWRMMRQGKAMNRNRD